MDGVLVIDKPCGPTSHDVVSEVKRILGAKKVGHLGTLDPAASGVLPLVINKATKFAEKLAGKTKVYEFDLVLGSQTDTDDDQGKVIRESVVPGDFFDQIQRIKDKFVGRIIQTPPAYSAVKVKGEALYKSARKGESASAGPRTVTIDEIEILACADDRIRMRVHCRTGTYIRALCRDMGEAIGSFGHAANIRRLVSGEYKIGDAIPLYEFKRLSGPDRMKRIKPLTLQTKA